MRRISEIFTFSAAFALVMNVSLLPAAAQNRSGDMFCQSQTVAGDKAKKKKAVVPTRSSPSGNPEWDVYVRGEYVGSDPDPRIRATIRREAVRNYGMR